MSGEEMETGDKNTFGIIFLSLFWILFGLAPFWIMNESFLASGDPLHADRCFLACTPGVCLLTAYVVDVMFVGRKRFLFASSFLLFVFSCSELYINQEAVYETKRQNDFYWQIAERIPGFQADTALLADSPIFDINGNFATSSALDIIYADDGLEAYDQLPVWVFSTYGWEAIFSREK